MMALLPVLSALVTGLAVVAALAPTLSRAQLLGAAMALGPALVAGLMSLAFILGAPLELSALVLAGSAALNAVWFVRRMRPAPFDRREWIGVAGSAVLLGTLLLRLIAVPAARGDGIAIHLLRAEALLQGCFWEWAHGAPAVTLHADYPPGMPALMATGQILGGARSDLAALAPLVLALPGVLLFASATLARTHGVFAALASALLMACTPGLRTHAVAGYADPLLAAVLATGAIALALRRRGLVLVSALLLPWLKLEGHVHAVWLALFVLSMFERRARLTTVLLFLVNAALWFVILRLHGVVPPIEEGIPDELRADLPSLLKQVLALGFTPHPMLAVIPGLGIIAAFILLRDARWKRLAALFLLLTLSVILLPVLRGTALQAVQAGDTLHRIFTQTLPLAILLAAAAASRIFERDSQSIV